MFLKQFAEFNSICIQCHDSPDADAMGAAFGLYAYFMNLGKKVNLIYAGEHQITKPSLKLMVEHLGIPIRYVNEMPEHDILIPWIASMRVVILHRCRWKKWRWLIIIRFV